MEFSYTSAPETEDQDQQRLVALLDAHAIPHATWTEQKTIEDLASELRTGDSTLEINEQGELRRHTAVVWVDVFSTNEQGEKVHLKEARQEFHDGRPTRVRKSLPASLGEKLLVGRAEPERPLEGARRALAEELGVEDIELLDYVAESQRESDASSYPGLKTVYTDHHFVVGIPFSPGGYTEVQSKKTSYFEWEQVSAIPVERFEAILSRVESLLPSIASELIIEHQDMSDPANVSFAKNPDDPGEHAPSWHQYGILTHSAKFREKIAADVPRLAEQWGVADIATTALSETIDGVPKVNLLQLAAQLHDIGKFTARTVRHTGEGTVITHFTDHEAHSGAIVRFGLDRTLHNLGLTEGQVEYVARCAELHFELGKVRRSATESGISYSIAFAYSGEGRRAMESVLTEHADYALEIGLMFTADSLSKADLAPTADTDEDIHTQRAALEEEIKVRGLNPNLIRHALQLPANIAVARQYLTMWAQGQGKLNHHQM